MADGLRLALFGGFRAAVAGTPVEGFISSKVQALLCYLAVTGRPHSRDTLAGLLWGEMQEEAASANLRVALSNLRRLVPDWLSVSRQTLAFNRQSPYWLDVETLQTNIQLAQSAAPDKVIELLHQAVELYNGEFLEGFFVRDAPAFEEWLLGQRERMRRLALQALHTLSARSSARGEYEKALGYTSRLLNLEPWQEEAHRQMMLLLALSGQRSAALSQFEICRTVLIEELGVEPMDETLALYSRIREGRVGEPAEMERLAAGGPRSHNLPDQLTPFIGRESELAQIAGKLASPDCRLLTLVGPGGIGKTRLSLQSARQYLEAGGVDGVFFVPLSAVASGKALISTIADLLGFPFAGPEDARRQLLNYLSEKTLLLVLDNFEHLRSETELVLDILRHSRAVKLLVTSRERLHIGAEHLLDIDGLPYPTSLDCEGLEDFAAIRLFSESAARVWADFSLSPRNLPAVVRVCQLVEGMPLAIELAAAWVRDFSCEEIAVEIQRSLDFLRTSLQDVPERHQSLRAVFDHSWDLLTSEERNVFQRMSVFHGGFRREAAMPVAGASLQALSSLGDKSLLRRVASGRYEIHELLRQYAAEQLARNPREHNQAQRHQSAYYALFLQRQQRRLQGGNQVEALEEINAEIENIRAAWHWAVEHAELEIIDQALESLFHFYDMRSWFAEGAEAFAAAAAALSRSALSSEQAAQGARLVGKLQARQGWFLFHLGDHQRGKALLGESIAALREHGSPQELAFSLNYLGAVEQHLGGYAEARALLEESLLLCKDSGDSFSRSIALNILGIIATSLGEYSEARRRCQESLKLKRQVGDRWGTAFSLTSLGTIAYLLGEHAEAQRLVQESLSIRREMGDRRGIALCLNHLGDVARALGDLRKAAYLYQQSLAIFEEIANRWGMTLTLKNLGDITCALESYEESHEYFRRALRTASEIEATGRIADVVAGLAVLYAKEGRAERAVELMALSLSHQGVTVDSRQRAQGFLRNIMLQLPPDLVAAAQERGTALGLDSTIQELML